MNVIQETKPAVKQWNRLLDIVLIILKYNKSTIDHDVYIKVLFDVNVSYIKVSAGYVLNATNNETVFPELRRFLEEAFEIKFQEGSVLKYLYFRILQSPLGFIVDQTDSIMELVNEWFPTGKLKLSAY